jgi:hypothetical protein
MVSVFRRLFGSLAPGPRRQTPATAPLSLFGAPPAPPATSRRLEPAHARFCHLRTGRDNFLMAGERIGMSGAADAGDRLIAMIPDANRQLCFLMAPDLRRISVQADGMRSIAISAFRLQTENGGLIRLRHPLAPMRFLAVTPAGHGAPDGCVIFDSLGRTRLDQFEPVALDVSALSLDFMQVAAELCAASAAPFRVAPLMAGLRTLWFRRELSETLIRVLPREELRQLAADLLADPASIGVLTELMPNDPWAARVLPELAMWRQAPMPVGPDNAMVSPASDEFAGDPLEGVGQPQAGFALNGLMRTMIRPRRGACLLAAARNEGPYLLEWLAYHQALGFEHAFIYTNDNWDGSDELLSALARNGVITLVNNHAGTHCGPQYKAYSHALSLLPHILDYAWTAVLDIDEFIGFDSNMFGSIGDFLAWQQTQPVDAVALCWQVFAGSRRDVWNAEPTISRFIKREPHPNAHVKSIFRPQLFWHSHAHFPNATLNAPYVFRTETGALHHHAGEQKRLAAFAEAPSAKSAWVNHYILRSAPEALWKLARGHGDWKGQVAERHLEMARFVCRTFVALADKSDLVEDRRILNCAPGRDAALATLRALPGVAEAEDSLKAEFKTRLDRMVLAFVDAPPPAGEPPEFAPFRAVLRGQLALA